jgi:Helix-turn-helix
MKATKREQLEDAGWTVGSAAEFLELSPEEETIVETKLALARDLKSRRLHLNLTQTQLAKRIASSQSRVAKMETADSSVSIDLLVRSLASLGASPREIGKAIIGPPPARRRAKRKASASTR